MKNYKYILSLILLVSLFTSCEEDNFEFGEIVAPININVETDIVGQDLNDQELFYGDGSGVVNFLVSADNAISYTFYFDDGTSKSSVNGQLTHLFTKVGVNTYDVTVAANGRGGTSSSIPMRVEVYSSFEDNETKDLLSGGIGSKTWYWAADKVGNIGLGPNTVQDNGSHTYPAWFFSDAFHADKLCMYDAEMVFTQDADGNLTYQQTVGSAYLPGSQAGVLGVDGDTCYGSDLVPSLGVESTVSLIPSSTIATNDGVEPTYLGTTIQFTNDAFMSWFVDNSNLEIITITDTTLNVRIEDGENAWYCKFQTSNPNESSQSFDTLVWSDEFETDGAVDSSNWAAETVPPNNGSWWNDEVQHYTDRLDNAYISEGTLKIVAKKEDYTIGSSTKEYTSARLTSKDNFNFTYGKVDIRAKLPGVAGTWPALWMLGSNIDDVGWPACGEIDIMEQWGNDKETVLSTLHFTDNSGGDGPSGDTQIPTASTAFHVYSVEWTEEAIKFSVDDQIFYSYDNTDSLPFNSDFYLIFNVAMGGILGGDIDPAFTESTMEIDYVRVYQ